MNDRGPIRVMIACTMKSGSTFVAKVLAAYLGVEKANPLTYWGRREQNLDAWHFRESIGDQFVLQMHLKPYAPHVDLFRSMGVRVAYLRRNLGDVLVSFDDHVLNESHENPVAYIHDRASYGAMPDQDRYRYLIRHAMPWYIGFHLMWRDGVPGLSVAESRYELMATEPSRFFSELIVALGYELDPPRLQAILGAPVPESRFNKGVVGRSVEALSRENRELIEEMLREHPEDLSELIEELPWHRQSRGAEVQDARTSSIIKRGSADIFGRLQAALRPGR